MLREAGAAFTINTEVVPSAGIVARLLGMTGLGPDYRAMTAKLLVRGSRFFPVVGKVKADQDAMISFFDDEVFTDANYLGNGLYRISPSLVCSDNDKACANMIAEAGLRVRTAIKGDALVCAIRLEGFDAEPVSFRLTHTSISVALDLDEMQHMLLTLASLTNAGPPSAALSGQVTGKLQILGAAQAKASLTFDRALSIRMAPAGATLNSDKAFSLSSAAAKVFSVTADGIAKTGSLVVGLGRTVVAMPDPDTGNRVELDLPGATLNATYAPDQPIRLTGLGLGNLSTSVLVNGARALTIDLNRDDGRVFDATVNREPMTGAETLTVTPKFDLRIAVDHAVLGDERPVYDVTRVLLAGSLRTTAASNQIEVVTGSFSITTAPTSYGFTATAGQCVTSSEDRAPNTQQLFTRWTVCTCK